MQPVIKIINMRYISILLCFLLGYSTTEAQYMRTYQYVKSAFSQQISDNFNYEHFSYSDKFSQDIAFVMVIFTTDANKKLDSFKVIGNCLDTTKYYLRQAFKKTLDSCKNIPISKNETYGIPLILRIPSFIVTVNKKDLYINYPKDKNDLGWDPTLNYEKSIVYSLNFFAEYLLIHNTKLYLLPPATLEVNLRDKFRKKYPNNPLPKQVFKKLE